MEVTRQFRVNLRLAVRREQEAVSQSADRAKSSVAGELAEAPVQGSTFRELVRELDEMVNARVRVTVWDSANDRAIVHWQGVLPSLQFATTGDVMLGLGEADDCEVVLSEESYVPGEVWTGGIRAVFGSVEVQISRLPSQLAPPETTPSLEQLGWPPPCRVHGPATYEEVKAEIMEMVGTRVHASVDDTGGAIDDAIQISGVLKKPEVLDPNPEDEELFFPIGEDGFGGFRISKVVWNDGLVTDGGVIATLGSLQVAVGPDVSGRADADSGVS